MTRNIDYYFATISPYAYLGHDRFVAIAQKHGATCLLYTSDAADE